MARILVTGSSDGLGLATARTLLEAGHAVVVHARSPERLSAVADLLDQGAQPVIGDFADVRQVREVADQANALGRMDAVIHNAGVVDGRHLLPVNVVAPCLLTAGVLRPARLIYLSSGMHRDGRPEVGDLDWSGTRATGTYSDSKLASRLSPPPSPGYGPTCSATPSIPAGYRPRWVAPARRTTCALGTGRRNGSPPARTTRPGAAAATGTTSNVRQRIRPFTTNGSRTPFWRRWPRSRR